MNTQKGFTLVELMVVLVIIGILATLAIPKFLTVSDKAKASEVPTVAKNWETLQASYVIEKAACGINTAIGFKEPTSDWWTYSTTATVFTATSKKALGDCAAGKTLTSTCAASGYEATFTHAGDASCRALLPSF
ncbi:MAG: type II secretion system protein [Fibrobacteria bacterium]|nr:type II secretion system protein [Fibrobacteria bacterium]